MVIGAGVVAALHVGKGAIAGPQLQSAFAIDLAVLAWVTAIFAVIGVFGGIPAGSMVAPVGDRRLLLSGLGFLAIGGVLGAMAERFPVMLGSRVVEGIGFLLIIVAGPAILDRLVSGRRRDLVLALWSCFMPTGMALALVSGPMFADWRIIWWASAGVSAASFLGVVLLVSAKNPVAQDASWRAVARDTGAVLRNPGALLLAAIFALYSLMFFALFSFLPVLLMDRLGASLSTAGLLAAAVTAINAAGNLSAGILLERGVGRSAVLAGTTLVMGVAALGIFVPVLPGMAALLLCLLFSALGGLLPATVLATSPLVARTPRQLPIVVGLIMQGSNVGQVVGPVAMGGGYMILGWSAGAVVVGLAAICATALAKLLSRVSPANL